jgi:soluble lytic murein transglycosylase-like protein
MTTASAVGQFQEMAAVAARAAGLPLALALATIENESSGRPAAWNPEPAYRYLWDCKAKRPFRSLTPAETASEVPPADFPAWPGQPKDAEWWGQQASWGLMQVMGGVARQQGFAGDFHTELCTVPALGVEHGCRYLAGCIRRWGSEARGVAAYNAGSPRPAAGGGFENQAYVDKILAARGRWLLTLGPQGG